ncbi:sugar ABC transporter substrate-binding protein [Paenibacillus wulumuqiensis]|uniref:sugar ABC transporter substrate-binding protein n=1 Tax=Paenibacillus wulumuqiensis TaxID=1567107 RepID=UPI000619F54D
MIYLHKRVSLALGSVCILLLCFTITAAVRFVQSEQQQLPQTSVSKPSQYRLVLITRDLGTPFWEKVGSGARQQAQQNAATLEVWGSYGEDKDDFLKQIEIAIDSKMDGIIVQGLDNDAFKELTKVKSAFYGIPIITVASDVPMDESLRKTYVGSDPVMAGRTIVRQMIRDMGNEGTVVLMGNNQKEYDQKQRLAGIMEVLHAYPRIQPQYVETPEQKEKVIAATQDIMNRHPNVNAFISMDANLISAMIQEISRRSQIEPYYMYSFDDHPDVLPLLRKGKLDAIIEQSPESMGKTSVEMMIRWLEGKNIPLDTTGSFTDIRVLKAEDVQ